jgi:hypothetical protein
LAVKFTCVTEIKRLRERERVEPLSLYLVMGVKGVGAENSTSKNTQASSHISKIQLLVIKLID